MCIHGFQVLVVASLPLQTMNAMRLPYKLKVDICIFPLPFPCRCMGHVVKVQLAIGLRARSNPVNAPGTTAQHTHFADAFWRHDEGAVIIEQ